MPNSHLHVSDRYIVLFKSRRIWRFDPAGLFKGIKWFPGFIQLLAGLLRCLGWKLSIPQISFMRFLLIIPVRWRWSCSLFCISSTKAVNNSHYQVSEGDHRQEIIRTFSGNKKPVVEGRTVEPFLLCGNDRIRIWGKYSPLYWTSEQVVLIQCEL